MVLLSFFGGFLETATFILAVVAFLLAVRFFRDSRKRLNEMVPGFTGPSRRLFAIGVDRSGFLVPKRVSKTTVAITRPSITLPQKMVPTPPMKQSGNCGCRFSNNSRNWQKPFGR